MGTGKTQGRQSQRLFDPVVFVLVHRVSLAWQGFYMGKGGRSQGRRLIFRRMDKERKSGTEQTKRFMPCYMNLVAESRTATNKI